MRSPSFLIPLLLLVSLLSSAMGDYRIRGSVVRRLEDSNDSNGGGGSGGSGCTKRERDRGKRNCGDNDASGGGGTGGGTESQQEESPSSSSDSKSADDKPIRTSQTLNNLKPRSSNENEKPVVKTLSLPVSNRNQPIETPTRPRPNNPEPPKNAYERLRNSYRSAVDRKNLWQKRQKQKFQQGTTNMLNDWTKKQNEKEETKRRKKGLGDDRLRHPYRPFDVRTNPIDPRAQRKRKEAAYWKKKDQEEAALQKKKNQEKMDKAMEALYGTPEEQEAYLESQKKLKRSPEEEKALKKQLKDQNDARVKKRLEEKAQREKEAKKKNKKKVNDKLKDATPRIKYLARQRSKEALLKLKQKKESNERIAAFQAQRAAGGEDEDLLN